MTATHVLINIVGEIALIVWGIHMVQTGVMRVFGSDLRRVLARGLRTRLHAFAAGLGVTALLQSSTATALMAASLAGTGALDLSTGLAIMLGANVGTTLIVQLLAFDVSMVFPVFLAAGVIAFRRGGSSRVHDSGRVLIGLGLILLALRLLGETIAPGEHSAAVGSFLAAVTAEPLINLLIAALITALIHSSVVTVLAVMSLAASGLLAPEATIAMVLGANIGSAINPVFEAGAGDPSKRRLPLGNLAIRLIGAAAVLPFLAPLASFLSELLPDGARFAANFHTGFNLALAVLFIGFTPLLARALKALLPTRAPTGDPAQPIYLDESALRIPAVALANAERETLRMVDLVDAMLSKTQTGISGDTTVRASELRGLDDIVDSLHRKLQLYLAALAREPLTESELQRLADIQAFGVNLEHIGDIIDKSLSPLVAKRQALKLSLSAEGLAEIDAMYAQLASHIKLAAAVFMSADMAAARRLVAEKDAFRALERASTERHFQRLREGRPASIETSGLHLDLIRDLKRIEAHLAQTAHPLLERSGELKTTRLAS
jgi:phosphate:Na+ symporter